MHKSEFSLIFFLISRKFSCNRRPENSVFYENMLDSQLNYAKKRVCSLSLIFENKMQEKLKAKQVLLEKINVDLEQD